MNPYRAWKQNRCGKRPGHYYAIEMIRGESTFILDPTIGCEHCGLPLPGAIYEDLTSMDELLGEG